MDRMATVSKGNDQSSNSINTHLVERHDVKEDVNGIMNKHNINVADSFMDDDDYNVSFLGNDGNEDSISESVMGQAQEFQSVHESEEDF
jgi:hypothetical protein